jgi:hypothetical protein
LQKRFNQVYLFVFLDLDLVKIGLVPYAI